MEKDVFCIKKLYFCISVILILPWNFVTASDGVLEINQACALNGGCFLDDEPGFPVTIIGPGSYRLTGSLAIPDANTSGIEIEEEHVTLDLNGFRIQGPTVCTGPTWDSPVTECAPLGTGIGIASDEDSITVSNGYIRGMGNDGVSLKGSHSRVERIHATSNGDDGIRVSDGGQIGGVVIDCTANDNWSGGISSGNRSLVRGNIAMRNQEGGIAAGGVSVVQGNNASHNNDIGISVNNGSTVTGNVASHNAFTGIFARYGSTILGNTANFNTEFGLVTQTNPTDSAVGYANNVFTDNNKANTDPQVSGANAIEIGTNICGTNATCP
jgi:parallel beta-helix repeat protein